MLLLPPRPTLSRGDVHPAADLRPAGALAWDIETSGLDWSRDRIASCQLACPDGRVYLVRVGDKVPAGLATLLANPGVKKVFHHAMFDLRFMAAAWGVEPRNVACTKVASKLLYPRDQDHSLRGLLARHLGVQLDKSARTSDWFADPWTPEQTRYAAEDVSHLLRLHEVLSGVLERAGLAELADRCYDHIPTRVALELRRLGDVFTY